MALWEDVVGYEGLYLISDIGEVLSLPRVVNTRNMHGDIVIHRKAKYIKPHTRGNKGHEYLAVTLSRDGDSIAYSLHRLVAEAFIPNPYNLPEVNHKDENPLNCCVDNLEWCDHQYNIDYSKSKRVAQYAGDEKVAEYKSISTASEMTGISRTSINNVLCGWSRTAGGYGWKYC